MNITLEKSDKLDRGERLIMVDGVQWGQMILRILLALGTSAVILWWIAILISMWVMLP